MTDTAGPSPPTATAILAAMGAWLRKNIAQAALFAVLGGAAGFVLNFVAARFFPWAMSPGEPASPGDIALASLGWGLASTVVCALLSYWFTAGTKRFVQALAGFPASLLSLFRAGGAAAQLHLLWGAGLALLVSVLISPAIAGVVAVAVIASLPSVFGGFVSGLLFRVWSAVAGLVSPTRKKPLQGAVMMAVGLMGSVAALVAGTFVRTTQAKATVAGLLVLAAFLMAQGAARSDRGPRP